MRTPKKNQAITGAALANLCDLSRNITDGTENASQKCTKTLFSRRRSLMAHVRRVAKLGVGGERGLGGGRGEEEGGVYSGGGDRDIGGVGCDGIGPKVWMERGRDCDGGGAREMERGTERDIETEADEVSRVSGEKERAREGETERDTLWQRVSLSLSASRSRSSSPSHPPSHLLSPFPSPSSSSCSSSTNTSRSSPKTNVWGGIVGGGDAYDKGERAGDLSDMGGEGGGYNVDGVAFNQKLAVKRGGWVGGWVKGSQGFSGGVMGEEEGDDGKEEEEDTGDTLSLREERRVMCPESLLFIRMYVYVCMYIWLYVHIYGCMYVYIYTHTRTHAHTHTHTRTHTGMERSASRD